MHSRALPSIATCNAAVTSSTWPLALAKHTKHMHWRHGNGRLHRTHHVTSTKRRWQQYRSRLLVLASILRMAFLYRRSFFNWRAIGVIKHLPHCPFSQGSSYFRHLYKTVYVCTCSLWFRLRMQDIFSRFLKLKQQSPLMWWKKSIAASVFSSV
jgi:hypothetical protein